MKLTPYGPGKFRCLVDVVAYGYTLDGAHDEETGDAETVGWFAMLAGPIDATGSDVEARLSAADRAFLVANAGGCIVSEGSDGFVSVDWFRTDAEREAEWNRIVDAVSDALSDEGDQ